MVEINRNFEIYPEAEASILKNKAAGTEFSHEYGARHLVVLASWHSWQMQNDGWFWPD